MSKKREEEDTLPELESLSKDSGDLLKAINDEPALPCILIAASYLDKCVGSVLKRRLLKHGTANKMLNSRGRNPFSDFSARIDAAFVIGLITETVRHNLHQVREIRNYVGHHHLLIDFGDKVLQEKCGHLKIPAHFKDANPMKRKDMTAKQRAQVARDQFILTVSHLAMKIILDGLSVTRIEQATGGVPW